MLKVLLGSLVAVFTAGIILFATGKLTIPQFNFNPGKTAAGEVRKGEQLAAETVNTGTQDLLTNTRDTLVSNINNTAEKINSTLNGTIPANSGAELNELPSTPSAAVPVTIFDFLSPQKVEGSLSKNAQYIVSFRNFPGGFCLFAGNKSFVIENNKLLSLTFNDNGNYDLRTDFCTSGGLPLGSLSVQ